MDENDPYLSLVYPKSFMQSFINDKMRVYSYKGMGSKILYSLEKRAFYIDIDFYKIHTGYSSQLLHELRYMYRMVRNGFFVFTQLNPVTELSIFFKDLDAYLAESNIDKVKNAYNKEQKAYWKQGVDLLKAEIKGRIKARGVALNEIDLKETSTCC